MVSVAELLNPEPPRAPLPTSRPPPVHPISQTGAYRNEEGLARRSIEALRMTENTKAPRYKARGAINFPPHENLDEPSLREVRRFHVHPFGSIRETCERIPYNSGKKDFFSKTGREGFEAFHYEFRVPGDDTNYTVMWDYSVGLVRMTSFFKCRGFSKTTPAKMLNMNPGLKDITYSITGGSIKAQGYWMPFACAKAICATFCYKIAGALIPLFGPQFPYECIHEKEPGYGRMIIDPELVARAKSDAAAQFRPQAALPSPRSSRSASPLPSRRLGRTTDPYDSHSDHDRRLLLSPYTDTDVDYHPAPEPYRRHRYQNVPPMRIPTSRPFGPAPVPTPTHSPPGWTAVNHPQPPAAAYRPEARPPYNHEERVGPNVSTAVNPWLSAVPRSPTPTAAAGPSKWYPYHPRSHYQHHPNHTHSSPRSVLFEERHLTLPPLRLKRRFDEVEGAPEVNNNNKHVTINNDTRHNRHDHGNNTEKPYRTYDTSPSPNTTGPSTPTSIIGTGTGTPTFIGAQAALEAQAQTAPTIRKGHGHGHGTTRAPPPTPVFSPTHTATASTIPTAVNRAPLIAAAAAAIAAAAGCNGHNGHNTRRASERDAAVLLLGLRGSDGGFSGGSSDDGDCDERGDECSGGGGGERDVDVGAVGCGGGDEEDGGGGDKEDGHGDGDEKNGHGGDSDDMRGREHDMAAVKRKQSPSRHCLGRRVRVVKDEDEDGDGNAGDEGQEDGNGEGEKNPHHGKEKEVESTLADRRGGIFEEGYMSSSFPSSPTSSSSSSSSSSAVGGGGIVVGGHDNRQGQDRDREQEREKEKQGSVRVLRLLQRSSPGHAVVHAAASSDASFRVAGDEGPSTRAKKRRTLERF